MATDSPTTANMVREAALCGADCTEAPGAAHFCGDGVVDGAEEECDDGNTDTEICDDSAASCTVCAADYALQADVPDCGTDSSMVKMCDDGNRVTETVRMVRRAAPCAVQGVGVAR